jgi:hypothetical protein
MFPREFDLRDSMPLYTQYLNPQYASHTSSGEPQRHLRTITSLLGHEAARLCGGLCARQPRLSSEIGAALGVDWVTSVLCTLPATNTRSNTRHCRRGRRPVSGVD